MSQVTKRKYVFKEVHEEFVLPDETRHLAKILAANLGNNLHKVETATGDIFLVSMPTKFRKNIYIKKDFFVLFSPIEEGKQVKGEITHILLKPQIEYIATSGKWPECFECPVAIKQSTNQKVVPATSTIPKDMLPSSDEDDDDNNDDDYMGSEFKIRNPNRYYDDDDSDDDDDDDEDEEEENDDGEEDSDVYDNEEGKNRQDA